VPHDNIEECVRVPISIPTRIKRRGQELRLRFAIPGSRPARRDPQLIQLMVKAHEARRELAELGTDSSKDHRRELGRLARLSYLAPDIIAAILEGRQPEDLTPRRLIRSFGLPRAWDEQRRMLGFN
jgi:hypothetical protein